MMTPIPTMNTTHQSPVESLVLARLLTAAANGDAIAKIKKDLEPLLVHRWAGAALTERIEAALLALQSQGFVDLLPGKTKKAAPKFVLTTAGRSRGHQFLGVTQLKPKTNWGAIRKTYLPARVLKLPAASEAQFKTLSNENAFQAILLKQQYELPIAEVPKPDQAIDALAWKLLGFEGETRKFDLKSVKTALFNRALGDGRVTDFKKAATRLLAHRLGARRDDPKELRDAVLRGWIDAHESATATPLAAPIEHPPAPLPSSPAAHSPPFDLPAFAQKVKETARHSATGRFGDNKVFIAHVWKAFHADPATQTMDLPTFKERLTEANNARLLDLSRADLVQAMDPEDVRQSEVHYLNATFHFVRI